MFCFYCFLLRCEICSMEEAKYRCPRCMKYSCSLSLLISDYRFLEDVARTADSASRDDVSHKPKSNKFVSVHHFLDHTTSCVQFLKNRARRYNIHLKTLPIGFTKRRENSTFFNNKYVYSQYYYGTDSAKVPDDKPLCDILKPYVDPQASDPVIRQRLKIYTTSSQSDIQILMKVENQPHNLTSRIIAFSSKGRKKTVAKLYNLVGEVHLHIFPGDWSEKSFRVKKLILIKKWSVGDN
ncbi:hypothetical protein JD844_017668 [Phrynosoma platyrhinos]|uniref:Uncharacterized protein n=1 Tax=Phrynosoma platyrhinos TaxID=52577 RepID=A0ABQ7SM89_PHRPL|nr:hypothetical protein JD844_017668 [Phrynosoma platyrhinos]